MPDSLEDHEGTVSIGGRTVSNLCFADDIDGLAGEESELAKLVELLNKASLRHGDQWYGHVFRSSGLARTILQAQ